MPIVIAHRGASGYRPEHTLAAYELAIEMGADFIEPDLVSTKDGVLVARHENAIAVTHRGAVTAATADVADHPEFADRLTTKTIDHVTVTGWFVDDVTLAELKSLRAVERLPHLRGTEYDGRFEIPTLAEIIELAKRRSAETGRTIGIYPETKHPTWFREAGLPLEEPLLAELERAGWNDRAAPVLIQSFEVGNLRALRARTDVRLIQLLSAFEAPFDFIAAGDPRGSAHLTTAEGLREIAEYADGIGPDKGLVMPRDSDGRLVAPTRLVDDAHEAGLLVHPWTFRSENAFLPFDLRRGDPSDPRYEALHGDATGEYRLFYKLGVDGVFSDFPDEAVRARLSQS